MVTRRSDQPRSGTAINAAVEVIGDRCWLPVLHDVMFGNTSATCGNDLKTQSPRTSSPTASGGWSLTVYSPVDAPGKVEDVLRVQHAQQAVTHHLHR
jgi:hypothetical protein